MQGGVQRSSTATLCWKSSLVLLLHVSLPLCAAQSSRRSRWTIKNNASLLLHFVKAQRLNRLCPSNGLQVMLSNKSSKKQLSRLPIFYVIHLTSELVILDSFLEA